MDATVVHRHPGGPCPCRYPPSALLLAAVALAIASFSSSPSAAAPSPSRALGEREAATEPNVHPTLLWAAAQLLPSPEWRVTERGVRFGVRWQVTPLLYSFGINKKLMPFRTLVVEPLVRHAGSVELFASPEYITGTPVFQKNWLLRGGLRAYFPLAHRGEYLSCSIGGSALYFREHVGASYEAGLYTLGGLVGVQVTYTPTALLRSTTFTLSLRYF
jgi:hypothetical protein